jgi:hypothetical protein
MATRPLITGLAICLLLSLFVWRELAAAAADGTTTDEPAHLAYAERGLAEGTFARDSDRFNSKMPVSVLNAVPPAVAERLGRRAEAGRRMWLARLPTVLLAAILGCLVLLWARELYGPAGGVLALFLYTFCPNILAHSHLVTTDVATALGMLAATYAFWRYRRRRTGGRLVAAAAAFGLAQLTKATAAFLAPIFLLVGLVEFIRAQRSARARRLSPALAEGAAGELHLEPRGRWTAAALTAAAMTIGAVVALNLGFAGEGTLTPLSRYAPVSKSFQRLAAVPVLRDIPLPVPLPYVAGLDMVARDARAGSPTYLRGRFSDHGFRSYYLTALLIKTPIGTLALILLAIWLAVSGAVRSADAEAFLAVPVLFLLAYLSFAFDLQIGLRYLLPAFPFLFVFAARVAAWRRRFVSGILIALCGGWTAVSSSLAHPHYISYFNEAIGGPRNSYRWLIDSDLDWQQDREYVREVYARQSPVKVWIEPTGPIAGRVAVGLTTLVNHHGWLRDHFRPAALIHNSWAVFDVRQADIERCCSGIPPAWTVPELGGDLATAGRAIGGSDQAGIGVRFLDRLNDGMVGANTNWDAAMSSPAERPVRAWFGIAWEQPREIGRIAAYPGGSSRGPEAQQFLAEDYALQWWDGERWRDLPGGRVSGNRRVHVEHDFPPVRTTRIRLLIERERNQDGTDTVPGLFRACCLELAAYAPRPAAPPRP